MFARYHIIAATKLIERKIRSGNTEIDSSIITHGSYVELSSYREIRTRGLGFRVGVRSWASRRGACESNWIFDGEGRVKLSPLPTEENFPMRNLGWLAMVKRPTTSETLLTICDCNPFTIRNIFAQRSDGVMRSSFCG